MGVDAADIFVALKPRDEWTSAATREELAEEMSEALEREVPEGAFSFSQPNRDAHVRADFRRALGYRHQDLRR